MATILIVDDSPTLRRMLKKELSGLGHEVTEFGDGVTALDYLASHVPALVISDVNMAPMDGFSFVNQVRRQHPREQLPVLFFTTEASDALKQRGRDAGANGWLTKPLVVAQLQRAIQHLLRHLPAPQAWAP